MGVKPIQSVQRGARRARGGGRTPTDRRRRPRPGARRRQERGATGARHAPRRGMDPAGRRRAHPLGAHRPAAGRRVARRTSLGVARAGPRRARRLARRHRRDRAVRGARRHRASSSSIPPRARNSCAPRRTRAWSCLPTPVRSVGRSSPSSRPPTSSRFPGLTVDDTLLAELADVRRRGWSRKSRDLAPGTMSVGVAVLRAVHRSARWGSPRPRRGFRPTANAAPAACWPPPPPPSLPTR